MDGKEIGIGDLRMNVEGGKGKGLGLEARTKDSLEVKSANIWPLLAKI